MKLFLLLLYGLFCVVVAVLLISMNVRFYHESDVDETSPSLQVDLLQQLRYLKGELTAGLGSQMQERYPEGYVFVHALYGLAWCNVAMDRSVDRAIYDEAMEEARWGLQKIGSEDGMNPFPARLSPPYGIFYNGWYNLLLAEIVATRREPNPLEDSLLAKLSGRIAAAFDASETPFLQSYVGSAWPADAVVAMASISHHDKLFQPRYQETLHRWLMHVEGLLDTTTGLIPHAVHPDDGSVLEGPRGSSQSLMLCLLPRIDSGFAAAQFANYKRWFSTTWLGLPAIREYPHGKEGVGLGDIDSGPVLFGVGASASIVGIGAMRANGDSCLAEQMVQTIDGLGFPLSGEGERWYLFGAEPMADAFLVWVRSLTFPTVMSLECSSSSTWRTSFHAYSTLFLLLVFLPFLFASRFLTRKWRGDTRTRDS